MGTSFRIGGMHRLESANYVTNVNPTLHPDRVMEVHDFLYILDGTWEIYEDGIPYELGKDDLLLLSAGKHHYGLRPCSAGNRHMYLHLYPEEAGEGLLVTEPLFHCASNPKIRQYVQELIAAYWSDHALKEEKISLLFGLFLCELSALGAGDGYRQKHARLIMQVLDLMQTNPQKTYTCQEMADAFYVCPKTLSNMFKSTYGQTFYSYQMNRKLEMVRQYLADHPEELLSNVARNFGFYDEFHLGKAFKKKYGSSPKHQKGKKE
ncbi:MAG: AraC family transcriptional regulator [Lachnospiraceae bacterium]|nr:AraC family transcriptional regulator [Lachnospiraceae bacterium]